MVNSHSLSQLGSTNNIRESLGSTEWTTCVMPVAVSQPIGEDMASMSTFSTRCLRVSSLVKLPCRPCWFLCVGPERWGDSATRLGVPFEVIGDVSGRYKWLRFGISEFD